MKKLFLLSSGLVLCSAFYALSSFKCEAPIAHTENGIYLGHLEDEDETDDYYSFETEDDYLDFYYVTKEVLEEFNLDGEDFLGAEFSLSYLKDDENGDLTLRGLKLIKKAEIEEYED